jgi:dienelactone hydrolase
MRFPIRFGLIAEMMLLQAACGGGSGGGGGGGSTALTPTTPPPDTAASFPTSGSGWRVITAPTNAGAGSDGIKNSWTWYEVDAPNNYKLLMAVIRPSGKGPFPVAVYLHGGAGLATYLIKRIEQKGWLEAGYMVVTGCWFKDRNPNDPVTFPIECPNAPAFSSLEGPDFFTNARPYSDALVRYAGILPGAAAGHVGVLGESRGGCAALLASSTGYTTAVASDSGDCWFSNSAKINNLTTAKEVATPVIFFHGSNDTGIPSARVQELVDALKANNKNYELIEYTGGNHVIDSSGNTDADRADMRSRTLTFFSKYVK